jgi:hypothetical protein
LPTAGKNGNGFVYANGNFWWGLRDWTQNQWIMSSRKTGALHTVKPIVSSGQMSTADFFDAPR